MISIPPGCAGKIVGGADPALGIAEIKIAVGKIDGEPRRHVIGETAIKRPGEIGFGVVLGERDTKIGNIDVLQANHVDRGEADADADIGRDGKCQVPRSI